MSTCIIQHAVPDCNSQNVKMSNFIPIPKHIAKLDLPLATKVIAGSLYMRCRNKTAIVKDCYLAEEWGIGSATVTRAIKTLEEMKIISTEITKDGRLVSWNSEDTRPIKMMSQTNQNDDSRVIKMIDPESSKRLVQSHQNDDSLYNITNTLEYKDRENQIDNTPPLTPPVGEARARSLEPFESGIAPSGGLPSAKIDIPNDLKRVASQINHFAEGWLFAHMQAGTAPDDWRIRQVLMDVLAEGKKPYSPKYFEQRLRSLPENKPAFDAAVKKSSTMPNMPAKISDVEHQAQNLFLTYSDQFLKLPDDFDLVFSLETKKRSVIDRFKTGEIDLAHAEKSVREIYRDYLSP